MELAEHCSEDTTFTLLDTNIGNCRSTYPSLPANVKAQSFDLLKDFASHTEWVDHFDLVHQRLMLSVFTMGQWRQVLQDLFKVLKPGGYLQLLEFDIANVEFRRWAEYALMWTRKFAEQRGINIDIVQDLPTLLTETGFVVVQRESRNPRYAQNHTKEPVPHAGARWYVDTMGGSVVRKGHELGLIGDDDFNNHQAGIREEAQTYSDNDKVPAVMIVARVSHRVLACNLS